MSCLLFSDEKAGVVCLPESPHMLILGFWHHTSENGFTVQSFCIMNLG
ncbi:hypothetical protein NFI96_017070 [Prochilodus magdalenae]|nr:hypothetical protein NFI96_017070 [Prochilodus magdalenae]